jgi:hypothetical protein
VFAPGVAIDAAGALTAIRAHAQTEYKGAQRTAFGYGQNALALSRASASGAQAQPENSHQ